MKFMEISAASEFRHSLSRENASSLLSTTLPSQKQGNIKVQSTITTSNHQIKKQVHPPKINSWNVKMMEFGVDNLLGRRSTPLRRATHPPASALKMQVRPKMGWIGDLSRGVHRAPKT